MMAIPFSWLVPKLLVCCLANRDSTSVFLLLQIFSDVVWRPGISIAGQHIVSEFSFLIHNGGYHNLFVCP